MHRFYDDPDEFDFSDSMAVRRIRRRQEREDRRPAGRRFHGPQSEDDFDDLDDFDVFDHYEVFDKRGFDNHS